MFTNTLVISGWNALFTLSPEGVTGGWGWSLSQLHIGETSLQLIEGPYLSIFRFGALLKGTSAALWSFLLTGDEPITLHHIFFHCCSWIHAVRQICVKKVRKTSNPQYKIIVTFLHKRWHVWSGSQWMHDEAVDQSLPAALNGQRLRAAKNRYSCNSCREEQASFVQRDVWTHMDDEEVDLRAFRGLNFGKWRCLSWYCKKRSRNKRFNTCGLVGKFGKYGFWSWVGCGKLRLTHHQQLHAS